MHIPLYQIDAFTQQRFCGNPAAVCILDEARSDEWMQALAAEMNLSETAFVRKLTEGYELRWFTPAVEVDLCGHATLATAHALWSFGHAPADEPISFQTRSGILTCVKKGDLIELDFPATPPTECDPPVGLLEALYVNPLYVGKSKFDKFIVVDSPAVVRSLKPDFPRLRELLGVRGVIVTSLSDDPRFNFISRFFGPGVGIDEDPVTGSAHCTLAPYWAERLGLLTMTGYQTSQRGGVVHVRLVNDRVILGGHAITVFHGELLVD